MTKEFADAWAGIGWAAKIDAYVGGLDAFAAQVLNGFKATEQALNNMSVDIDRNEKAIRQAVKFGIR